MIGISIWLVFGAVIGYMAAQKKGWNPAMGILGGVLLGILSPLLFCVSSVAGKADQIKCPNCAEWVKAEARVCRYCQRELPAKSRVGMGGSVTMPRR